MSTQHFIWMDSRFEKVGVVFSGCKLVTIESTNSESKTKPIQNVADAAKGGIVCALIRIPTDSELDWLDSFFPSNFYIMRRAVVNETAMDAVCKKRGYAKLNNDDREWCKYARNVDGAISCY